jgi:hypothetical protein
MEVLYFIAICVREAVGCTLTPLRNSCLYCFLTQLAEYAHEKTGYYYDEDLHKEVRQKLKTKFKRASSQN